MNRIGAAVAATGAATIGLCAVAALALPPLVSGQQGDQREIARMSGQLRTLQRSNARLSRANSLLTSSQNGSHRNVITCGDLFQLGIEAMAEDGTTLSGAIVSLPSHCYNN